MNTTIVYTPSITPPAASVARQRAYSEHAPLLGPAQDPDGWQTLPKVTISGELLGQQKVEVECTLSLAKPVILIVSTSPINDYIMIFLSFVIPVAPSFPAT